MSKEARPRVTRVHFVSCGNLLGSSETSIDLPTHLMPSEALAGEQIGFLASHLTLRLTFYMICSTDSRLSTDPVALNRFLLRHSEAPPELLLQVSEVHYSSSPHGAFAEGFYFAVSAGKAVEIGLGKGAKPLLYSDGSWALSLRGEPQGTRTIADEYGEEIDQLEAGHLNGTSAQGHDAEPTRGDHGGSVGIGWEGRLDGRGGRVTLVAERYDRLAMEQDRRARQGSPRFISKLALSPCCSGLPGLTLSTFFRPQVHDPNPHPVIRLLRPGGRAPRSPSSLIPGSAARHCRRPFCAVRGVSASRRTCSRSPRALLQESQSGSLASSRVRGVRMGL